MMPLTVEDYARLIRLASDAGDAALVAKLRQAESRERSRQFVSDAGEKARAAA